MKISLPKLKAMLLFFSTYTDSRFLGKVKLMKLFYFVDFEHVRRYGAPITFDKYVHLERGPIPSTIKNLVDTVEDDFENSILGDTITVEMGIGGLHKIISSRKFTEKDARYFTESEIKILSEITERFCDSNAQEMENISHKENPWKDTELLDYIPYSLAIDDIDQKEAIDLAMQLMSSK